MTNQRNERRHKGRYGVLERVENITYTILRAHGIAASKQDDMYPEGDHDSSSNSSTHRLIHNYPVMKVSM